MSNICPLCEATWDASRGHSCTDIDSEEGRLLDAALAREKRWLERIGNISKRLRVAETVVEIAKRECNSEEMHAAISAYKALGEAK